MKSTTTTARRASVTTSLRVAPARSAVRHHIGEETQTSAPTPAGMVASACDRIEQITHRVRHLSSVAEDTANRLRGPILEDESGSGEPGCDVQDGECGALHRDISYLANAVETLAVQVDRLLGV